MNPSGETTPCAEIAPLLVFYVCDELTEQERAEVEKHLAACDECRAQLSEEREFHGTLSDQPSASDLLDPTGLLLSHCRSELAEKIDDLARPPSRERAFGLGWMRRWMVLRPACSPTSGSPPQVTSPLSSPSTSAQAHASPKTNSPRWKSPASTSRLPPAAAPKTSVFK